jgi:hypothetical protein
MSVGGGIVSRRERLDWVQLLAAILWDSPKLEDSLCRDRHWLFDADIDDHEEQQYATERAIALCHRCPALAACREWAATQSRLSGVVAGELHYHHHTNPGNTAA